MSDTQTPPRSPLHLFEGFGVELEYMIVNTHTYQIESVADRVLATVAGAIAGSTDPGNHG